MLVDGAESICKVLLRGSEEAEIPSAKWVLPNGLNVKNLTRVFRKRKQGKKKKRRKFIPK
jgi:hypothetical protein